MSTHTRVSTLEILTLKNEGNYFWRLFLSGINFYLLRTFCPHLDIFFLCVVSSFTRFRPNFTSGLLQVILPRSRIGMMSLVTVFPIITAFHSCCLLHRVFWPGKSLAGLRRIWNRYLLTMLTWNRRTFCPHLGMFFFFCVVSSFTTFRPNFTSGLLQVIFTATTYRNDESCTRIHSNYCLPWLLSIAPRFLTR